MASYDHNPLLINPSDKSNCVLVVLNNGPSLCELKNLLLKYWSSFSVHVCADGGSNSLYDSLNEDQRLKYIPDIIIGDFDSIRQEVLSYYRSKGSMIVHDTDQNTTDFGKALTYISIHYSQCHLVYALNCMWGRFDQVLGNIHELFTAGEGQRVYLVTEDSFLMLLTAGNHCIQLKRELVEGHCGLIPLGEPCKECWSTGLQWNLEGHEMMIGKLISTCNLLAPTPDPSDYTVTVRCSHNLIFSVSHKLCV